MSDPREIHKALGKLAAVVKRFVEKVEPEQSARDVALAIISGHAPLVDPIREHWCEIRMTALVRSELKKQRPIHQLSLPGFEDVSLPVRITVGENRRILLMSA